MAEIDVVKHIKMDKKNKKKLLAVLEEQFKKVCVSANLEGETVNLNRLQYFFGGIMVKSRGTASLLDADDGYKVKVSVNYGMSTEGIVLTIICFFFGMFGIIIPLWIYFSSQGRVQDKIEKVLTNVKEEME